MSEDEGRGQREFDLERDRAAVEKLKDWGINGDPLLKSLGGEPWWKAWIKKKPTNSNPESTPKK